MTSNFEASIPNVLDAESFLLTEVLGEEIAANLFKSRDPMSVNIKFEGLGLSFHKIYKEIIKMPANPGMRDGNDLRANTIFGHAAADYMTGLKGRLNKLGNASDEAEILSEVFGAIGATGYLAAGAARAAQAAAVENIARWHDTKGKTMNLAYPSDGGITLDTYLKSIEFNPASAINKHKSVILHNIDLEIARVLQVENIDKTILTSRLKAFFDAAETQYSGNAAKLLIIDTLKEEAEEIQSKAIDAQIEKARADLSGDAEAIKLAQKAVTKMDTELAALKADLQRFNTDNSVQDANNFQNHLDSSFSTLEADRAAAEVVFSRGNARIDELEASYKLSVPSLGLGDSPKITPKLMVGSDIASLGSSIAKLSTDAFRNGSALDKAATYSQLVTDGFLSVADGLDVAGWSKSHAGSLGVATAANITTGALRLEQLRTAIQNPNLSLEQRWALEAEFALQTTAVTLSTLQGVMEIGVYAGGTAAKYLSKVAPVLGSIAAVASAINPTKWAEFSAKKAQITEIQARDDYSSDMLGDMLSDSLQIQKDFYVASTTVDTTFAVMSGLLVAGGATAPIGFAVAAVGGLVSGLIKMFEEPKLQKLVETYQNKMTNGGQQSIDDFFANSFAQEWQETQADYKPMFDSFLQDGDYGSAVLLGSESFTQSDLQLIEQARVLGEVTKSSGNFGASYTIEAGWDSSVVNITEHLTEASTVEFTKVNNADRYVTFSAPLMDADAGNYIAFRSFDNAGHKQEAQELLAIGAFTGWVVKDDTQGTNTTFDINKVINTYTYDDRVVERNKTFNWTTEENRSPNPGHFTTVSHSSTLDAVTFTGQKATKTADFSVKGNDGDDTYIAHEGWVNFDGGTGSDTASYAGLDGTTLARGITIEDYATQTTMDGADPAAADEMRVFKTVAKGSKYWAEELQITTIGAKKKEFSFAKEQTRSAEATVHDDLKSVETILGSKLGDDIDVRGHAAAGNTVKQIHGLGGDDKLVGDTTTTVITGGQGDDVIDATDAIEHGVTNYNTLIARLSPNDPFLSSLIGTGPHTQLSTDRLQSDVHAVTGQWADAAFYAALETPEVQNMAQPVAPVAPTHPGPAPSAPFAWISHQAKMVAYTAKVLIYNAQQNTYQELLSKYNEVNGPGTPLTDEVVQSFFAKLGKAITGEMVYADGGDGKDILKWSTALTPVMRDAYVELASIQIAAFKIAKAISPSDPGGLANLLTKQMSTDYLNPFAQLIATDVERVEFQLSHTPTLAVKPVSSTFEGLLNSAQLTGEDEGDSVDNATWYARDYNKMIDTVLNTTKSHTEFMPRAIVEDNRVAAYPSSAVLKGPLYSDAELLLFATRPHTVDRDHNNQIVHGSLYKDIQIRDDHAKLFLNGTETVELTESTSQTLEGEISPTTVISHVVDYYVQKGMTYTFRYEGGIGAGSNAVVEIGGKSPLFHSSSTGSSFTYTAAETGYVPLKFVVHRGNSSINSTNPKYGLFVKQPGETDFVAVGTERDILLADDAIGYQTRGTTMALHGNGGVSHQGHEGELSGTLQAGQKVVYSGEIYLEADRVYEFTEMAPGTSRLIVGTETVLDNSSAATDERNTIKIDQTGFYAYQFEATNTTGQAGKYAVAISSSTQGKFLVLQGETGAPTAALTAKGLAVGVNLIGDVRSEDLTGSAHDDFILGHLGHDRIEGGLGNDVYVGGGGIDTFVFGLGTGHDLIVEAQAADGASDVLLYEGLLADVTRHMHNGDLIIFGQNQASSVTIANYASLGGGRVIQDSSGAEMAIDQLPTAGPNLPLFLRWLSKKKQVTLSEEYNTAHSSDAFQQARDSFLGAGADFDSGKTLSDAEQKYLGSVIDATNDISFTDALALDMLTLDQNVTLRSNSRGDHALKFTTTDAQATIDLGKLYPGADGTTPTNFSFGANVKFDSLGSKLYQRVFRIDDGAGNFLILNQGWKPDEMLFSYYKVGGGSGHITAKNVVVAGEWAHWGVTIDDGGNMALYKNGDVVASGQAVNGFDFQAVTKAHIGSDWYYTNNSMVGEITDFWFMDDAISAQDMALAAAAPRSELNAAPVATDAAFATTETETKVGAVFPEGLLATVTDADGDALTVTHVNGGGIFNTPSGPLGITNLQSAGGRDVGLVWSDNGLFGLGTTTVFEDLKAGQTDTISFSYTVSDGNGGTTNANATITVQGENDPVGEWGNVMADGSWTTVNFNGSYTNPVVVAFIESSNDSLLKMAEARLRNIDGDSFEVKVQATSDYRHLSIPSEKISYMVLEEGSHKLVGGPNIFAGTVDAGWDNSWHKISTGNVAGNPFVFSSLQDTKTMILNGSEVYNQDVWGGDRIQRKFTGIDSNGNNKYDVSLAATREVEEAQPTAHTHGYIAFQAGNHALYKTDFKLIQQGNWASMGADDFEFAEFTQVNATAPRASVARFDTATNRVLPHQDGPVSVVPHAEENVMLLDFKQDTGFFYAEDIIG